jgi:hypothetical protein
MVFGGGDRAWLVVHEPGKILHAKPSVFSSDIRSSGLKSYLFAFQMFAKNSARKFLQTLGDYLRLVARVMILLNSRSHSTELATAAQRNQSPRLKLTVEKACCRNGM